MLRVVVVSAALLPMLSGCAAPTAQMANAKGQTAQCRSAGFGVLGSLIAVSMYQTCVDDYQKQGYHQVPVTPAAAAPAAPAGQGTTK